MVDIQSVSVEIRRGIKKEDRRKKPQGKNIMSASATQCSHNKKTVLTNTSVVGFKSSTVTAEPSILATAN